MNSVILAANQVLSPLFALADAIRQAQGENLRVLGFGPAECSHRIIASDPLWRLRHYAGPDTGAALLIVAAPIKRPYIWDLAPEVSAIRYCLQQGLRIYLLEWRPPSRRTGVCGLAEYADKAVSEAVARVSEEAGGVKPFLVGHSLGGTLAAITAALHVERLSGLVLLSAPLSLHPGASAFRDALAAMAPSWLSELEIVPGSLLSQVSTMASPGTFIWSRLQDASASATDPRAQEVRSRIERWSLDEVPLPGKLVHQVFQWLYRENRFCKGTLVIQGRKIGPSCVRLPTLAVANATDQVAPPTSIIPFLEAMQRADTCLIEYPGEPGVVLQHLGILVGRDAFARIWPQIVSWISAHS